MFTTEEIERLKKIKSKCLQWSIYDQDKIKKMKEATDLHQYQIIINKN